ncbi:hypothetical protein [Glycomyces rhizosphaerae]|uniref:Uncharacterized protein n=1 Tax=Glycomyces rhizosphaerae TaxID=2054422 RepID=A0ABV7Q4I4_9ACTN
MCHQASSQAGTVSLVHPARLGTDLGAWGQILADYEPGLTFPLPGGGFVVLSLDPGISVGNPSELPEQQVVGVCLSHIEDYPAYERQERSHPTEIDPVIASEVLTGLARVTRIA